MRYLSDEWFVAADAALRSTTPTAPVGIVLDQVVSGIGAWRAIIDPDGSRIDRLTTSEAEEPDSPERPAATFRQNLATAEAIARGDLDAHQALLLGRVEFSGDVGAVIEASAALEWLATALEPVMAQTDLTG